MRSRSNETKPGWGEKAVKKEREKKEKKKKIKEDCLSTHTHTHTKTKDRSVTGNSSPHVFAIAKI